MNPGIAADPVFQAPFITPPAERLGFLEAIRAIMRNPIEVWPQEFYRTGYMRGRFGRRTVVHVARPDLIHAVFVEEARSLHRSDIAQAILKPAMREGLLTAEDEVWRAQRRIAAPAFRQQMLDSLVPLMDKAGDALAERLKARRGQAVNVMPEMIRATFSIISDTMFGETREEDARLIETEVGGYLSSVGKVDLFDMFGVPYWVPRPWKRAGKLAVKRLRARAERSIADLRAKGATGGSLTALLMNASDPETGGAMSEDQLIDNIITFIGAGHETTSLALTWSLYLVAQQPNLQKRLADEVHAVAGQGPILAEHVARLELRERVLKEAMRLYPPVALIGRKVVKPMTLNGDALRPGDQVVCGVLPLHRSPTLWENPDAFDPDRFLPERSAGRPRYAWMPFGAGPRICIGMGFAMMEGIVLLAHMMRAVRFAPVDGHEVKPVVRVTMRPRGGMPLKVA